MNIELLRSKLSYLPTEALDEIERAYRYSESAHSGQLRHSGKPYIMHPLAVADILADWKVDRPTIVAALLHDVVEDTPVTVAQIREAFGGEIALLVDGLSKIDRLEELSLTQPVNADGDEDGDSALVEEETAENANGQLKSAGDGGEVAAGVKSDGEKKKDDEQMKERDVRDAANFRKLLLAASNDWRVLFVKLADRLHNMRTLNAMKNPQRRREIARETEEIYAKIAGRFGFQSVQIELENLALRYLHPQRFRLLNNALKELGNRHPLVMEAEARIREKLDEGGFEYTLERRIKSCYSVHRKLAQGNARERHELQQLQPMETRAGKKTPLEKILAKVEDVVGFRVIVNDRITCYLVLGLLHEMFTPLAHRFRDFIALPRANRYQSLHTGISFQGLKIDMQIRTPGMHQVAQYGLAAHWRYKKMEGNLDEVQDEALRLLSSLVLVSSDSDESGLATEYMNKVKVALTPEEMMVLTPKGKIIKLPYGATALDMAYAIHTQVGNSASEAIINGEVMPRTTLLNSGDMVEIITDPKQMPQAHWLQAAKTQRAQTQIRNYLRSMSDKEALTFGKRMLRNAARRISKDVKIDEVDERDWRRVIGGNNFKTRDELYRALGMGRLLPDVVAHTLLRRRVRSSNGKDAQPILIVGAGRSAVHLSPCCQPLPGESIVGILRSERGLVIHAESCPKISGFTRNSERWIEVQWDDKADENLHKSAIRLSCSNRPGLISAISGAISGLGINIVTCNFEGGAMEHDSLSFEMIVEVHSLAELESMLDTLKELSEVITVDRHRETTAARAYS